MIELKTSQKNYQKDIKWKPPQKKEATTFLTIEYAILLPASLRKHFKQACTPLEIAVSVIQSKKLKPSPFVALTSGARQQRRLTWKQRFQKYQLPDKTKVNIEFRNCSALAISLIKPAEDAMESTA